MYNLTYIPQRQANTMRENPNWIWYCENHHGTCYWNNVTGEIMWVCDDEKMVKLMKNYESKRNVGQVADAVSNLEFK